MKHEHSRSIQKGQLATKCAGFSLVEALLSIAIFGLFVTVYAGTYLYGEESSMLSGNRSRAIFLAEEGLEAVKNMRDENFSNLTVGTHGLALAGNQWVFSGAQDVNGIFTRQVTITSLSANRKSVTSTVTWQQNPQRTGSVSLATRYTNWLVTSNVTATCNEYALEQGYSSGTCRQNTVQCGQHGESNLVSGNIYCTSGAPSDVCCVSP